jgi:hypothetical protein
MKAAKKKKNTLLRTYNLSHTVNFATRTQNSLSRAIDNIFIEIARLGSSCTSPIVNSLSDHDAQFLTIDNNATKENLIPPKQKTRKINNATIAQFQHLLPNETWQPDYKIRIQTISLTLFYTFL